MTLWLNHTIDERIAMLQRAEEKFRINPVSYTHLTLPKNSRV